MKKIKNNKKIFWKTFIARVTKITGSNQFTNACTLILAITTFFSAKAALEVAFNDNPNYISNNGFHIVFDNDLKEYYTYYSISLVNASTNKPINLIEYYTIEISTKKKFSKSKGKNSYETMSISELLNIDSFPINLKYGEEISFYIDEDFAKYVQYMYPGGPDKCNKLTNKCRSKSYYINFCLYDTLENQYCYIFTEDEINQISRFTNGRRCQNIFYDMVIILQIKKSELSDFIN